MQIEDIQNLEQISEFIRKKIGIYFPPNKYAEMSMKLKELARENGFKNIDSFIRSLSNGNGSRQKAEILASKLSIGETYFWRDRELFRVLEEELFPKLIREKENTRRVIRIWSAASSTGEEAYSIAILLKKLIPNINDWQITILATDINPNFLEKAKKGRYTEWSFRSAPAWLKTNHFKEIKHNEYALDESIKRMVHFSYLNLIEDVFPSLSNNTNGMDMIFCRNVLMYFSHEDIIKVSEKLYNCLLNDGVMITTPSESSHFLSPRFKTRLIKKVSLHLKEDKEIILDDGKILDNQEKIDFAELIKNANAARKKSAKTKKESLQSKGLRKTGTIPSAENEEIQPTNNNKIDDVLFFINKGEYERAESVLSKIMNSNANPEQLLLMARIKANLGKLNEALEYCNQSLELNKIDPVAYYIQSIIIAEKGDLELAYSSLKKSFYVDPQLVITNFMLANFANQLGRQAESKKYYSNTLDLLEKYKKEEIIPESDGMTAGRMMEIVNTING